MSQTLSQRPGESVRKSDGVEALQGNGNALKEKRGLARVIAYGSETATQFLEEFGALIVDWSVSFESERDEGIRMVESCVLGFLSTGRNIHRAACTRCREVQIGVGDDIGDGDVPGDIFFPPCHGMSVMTSFS